MRRAPHLCTLQVQATGGKPVSEVPPPATMTLRDLRQELLVACPARGSVSMCVILYEAWSASARHTEPRARSQTLTAASGACLEKCCAPGCSPHCGGQRPWPTQMAPSAGADSLPRERANSRVRAERGRGRMLQCPTYYAVRQSFPTTLTPGPLEPPPSPFKGEGGSSCRENFVDTNFACGLVHTSLYKNRVENLAILPPEGLS